MRQSELEQRLNRQLDQATRAFSDNRIVERGDCWWRCTQPQDGAFAFDTYCDDQGGISVIGAAAGVRFSCVEGSPSDKVFSIGERPLDAATLECAEAGSACSIWEFDGEIAACQLRAMDHPGLSGLAARAPEMDAESFYAELLSCGVPKQAIGRVPSFRVICGYVALVKLSQLLRAEDPAIYSSQPRTLV